MGQNQAEAFADRDILQKTTRGKRWQASELDLPPAEQGQPLSNGQADPLLGLCYTQPQNP